MAKYPLTPATSIPAIMQAGLATEAVPEAKSFRSRTRAPNMAGMDSRNEKRTAVFLSSLANRPPTMVLPLRLKDGSQRVRELCFALEPGEREIRLVRPIENGQQEAARPLPPVVLGALTGEEGGAPLQTADEGISPTGDVGTLDALRGGQRAVCIWICEGEEPTEHILNEMLERIGEINEHQKEIFLISRRPPRASGTLERLLREAEGLRLYKTPDWNGAAAVARAMEAEENRYPLAVAVQEDGRGVYASCGYQVGAAAQLLAALQRR